MTDRQKKLKADKIKWAVELYNQGRTGRQICEMMDITPPTLYRYIRESEDSVTSKRRSSLWNDSDAPSHARSVAAINMWEKKRTALYKGLKKVKLINKPMNILDILSRLKLSIGKDFLGNYLYAGDNDRKVYLTEQEFNALYKKPFETIQVLALRINAGLGKQEANK